MTRARAGIRQPSRRRGEAYRRVNCCSSRLRTISKP